MQHILFSADLLGQSKAVLGVSELWLLKFSIPPNNKKNLARFFLNDCIIIFLFIQYVKNSACAPAAFVGCIFVSVFLGCWLVIKDN